MAQTGTGALLCRRDIKLDSFLMRNTERAVYERIRAYEPCVVISESINKVYMHVVLSDVCVYLTEYPPRALKTAFSFRRVRDIELINDLPDFLRGKDRELCQHIRITYLTDKPATKASDWLRRDNRAGLPPVAPPSRRNSHCPILTHTSEGYPAHRNQSDSGAEDAHLLPPMRSASWPNQETLGLLEVPRPPPRPPSTASSTYSGSSSPTSPPSPSDHRLNITESSQVTRRIGSVLSRLFGRDGKKNTEKREAVLHLYAVSHNSRIYLHLKSSWNSFIIGTIFSSGLIHIRCQSSQCLCQQDVVASSSKSTLMLDPLYRRRCSISTNSSPRKKLPSISFERTAHLFRQLSAELLQEDISVEGLYLLLKELRTAAHRNVALRKLFWRSSELCVFLVQTLEETLHGCQSFSGVNRADQLILSTVIVQTLAVMFRETEFEPARQILLSAKKGALASRMLLALICDPELQTENKISLTHCELKALLAEYLEAACSLLFEMLLLGQEASRCSPVDNFLSVGWILKVLQTQPHLLTFIDYQAMQVVLVLSDLQESFLSPAQSVLLYQRCHLLLACLRFNSQLAQHLRSQFREEFRYSVKLSVAEEKLPLHYPISQPTLRLVEQIQTLHK